MRKIKIYKYNTAGFTYLQILFAMGNRNWYNLHHYSVTTDEEWTKERVKFNKKKRK